MRLKLKQDVQWKDKDYRGWEKIELSVLASVLKLKGAASNS